jgi:hypothetical protein
VSNSSSSSFITFGIDTNKLKFPDYSGELVVDGNFGETEFGWGPGNIFDVGSKIIFAYIQSGFGKNKEYLGMLEKVLREYCGVTTFVWDLSEEYDYSEKSWAYIDHQSSYLAGKNLEIFDSEDRLKRFLFDNNSYIHLDNDNH